jgi:hypothetical protein
LRQQLRRADCAGKGGGAAAVVVVVAMGMQLALLPRCGSPCWGRFACPLACRAPLTAGLVVVVVVVLLLLLLLLFLLLLLLLRCPFMAPRRPLIVRTGRLL